MKKTFLFALCCSLAGFIYAQNIVKEHYTVSGGILGAANFSKFRITDNNPNNIEYKTKAGWSVGGWVNFPVSKGFSIEPQVMHSSYQYLTDNNNALIKDGKLRFISVPLFLKFHAGDYFAITAGPQVDFLSSVENNSGSNAQEENFNQTSFSGFGGVEIMPHGRVVLFARYIFGLTNMDKISGENGAVEYKNQNIQAGLKFRLFGKKVPADSDGDGISDPNDKCPNVIGLARYDGCPIPDTDGDGINDEMDKCPNQAGTSKYDGCPIPDTDGDGINDELDKCPNQAGTAKYNGCPIPDTDGDGINDELDKCPSQAGTAKYDGCPVPDRDNDGINDENDKCPDVAGIAANDGCPEAEVKQEVSDKLSRSVRTNAQSIKFSGTTTTITSTSNTALNNIVKILNENPDLKAKIEAHTDNAGDDTKNMTLSTNRAEAVKAYLVKKGISADRITTEGFGETMPIADNTTVAGRTKNRRVEIKLMY